VTSLIAFVKSQAARAGGQAINKKTASRFREAAQVQGGRSRFR
jgi:hypothetical protein